MDKEDTWQDWERTTAILRMDISTEGEVEVKTTPIDTISGHAIARWYQRSSSRDPSKLLDDLSCIIDASDQGRVTAPNGVWLGPVTNAFVDLTSGERRRMMIRTIRTFIDHGLYEPEAPAVMTPETVEVAAVYNGFDSSLIVAPVGGQGIDLSDLRIQFTAKSGASSQPPGWEAVAGQIVCYLNRTYGVLPTRRKLSLALAPR